MVSIAELDPWQREVLEAEDCNIAIRSARQAGKSTIIAIKCVEHAINHPKHLIMIVAATERQAYLLFERCLAYLVDNYPRAIKKGKDRPTKHIINLHNGAIIRCEPCGMSGYGLRGFTINLLVVDEAHYVPEDVYTALTPALSVAGGHIILLSTPKGRDGYFYHCFSDPNFKTWHITWRDCPRHDPAFIEQERKRMSKMQFMQEYEAAFVDSLFSFFPTELIQSCMTLDARPELSSPTVINKLGVQREYFIGADIARLGSDETTIMCVERINKDTIQMVDLEVTRHTHLTETIRRLVNMTQRWNPRKLFIDSGGVGGGVVDALLEIEETKRRVVAIDNAARSLDRDSKQKRKLLKEDLYSNLLRAMEQKKVKLFKEPEIELSLKSIQFEYTERGDIHIFGNYSHITESLTRCAYCLMDKSLKIWVC